MKCQSGNESEFIFHIIPILGLIFLYLLLLSENIHTCANEVIVGAFDKVDYALLRHKKVCEHVLYIRRNETLK